MSVLIFCSFEVGGFPYLISRTLNGEGVRCLYLSAAPERTSHDSTSFHYGQDRPSWHLRPPAASGVQASARTLVRFLQELREREQIVKCLATGDKAYLLREAGISYLYWSFGSDLDQLCFGPIWPPGYPISRKALSWLKHAFVGRRLARRSLRCADAVMISPYQLARFRKIAPSKRLFFLPHILPGQPYEELVQAKESARQTVLGRTGAHRYFFSATRHVWTDKFQRWADLKANDVMFRAYARFLALSGDRETKLVVIEKGPDVPGSKALAADLGIAGRTVWLPEMPRPLLMEYYRGAIACFGQFGTPVITYSALEPLSQGTPCVSYYGEHPPPVPFYADPPPLLNTREAGEIASFLNMLTAGGEEARAASRRAWDWTTTQCSESRFAKAFLEA